MSTLGGGHRGERDDGMRGTSLLSIVRWLAIIVTSCALPFVDGQTYTSTVLVWEENFDGTALNGTVWEVDTGNGCDQGDNLCGWGNNEQQTYTTDNYQVEDGVLTISAELEEELVDERSYTSSRIRTKSPIAFLTGRIEARIRLPQGQGLWPAFWMLPADTSRGVWAATGEIDIMEAVNDMDEIFGTIHYGGEFPANVFAGCRLSSGIDFSTDYHVYALEWEAEEFRWYVDDQIYCTRTKWSSTLASYEPYIAPFDTEFEIILNLAVGGSLPGSTVDDTALPAHMLVDYIRVYEIDLDNPIAEPFFGWPQCLPGIIEAETFDVGGLGLGFGDSDPGEGGAAYRADSLGRVQSSDERMFIANMTESDWTAYTVVSDETLYDIVLEVMTPEAAAFQLVVGDDANCSISGSGIELTEMVAISPTLNATNGTQWEEVTVNDVWIPAGEHSLKLCVHGGVGTHVDRLAFAVNTGSGASLGSSATPELECTRGTSRPYMFGEPWAIPGYIEAEFYDYGGEGVGFHEIVPEERSGDSDIRPADAVGIIEAQSEAHHGQYIGHLSAGEWLSYTAYAEVAGHWDVVASVASGVENSVNTFRILANATNCTTMTANGTDGMGATGVDLLGGPASFGYTGSWEAFTLTGAEEVWIPAGTHRILFCVDTPMFNLNYLRVYIPVPTPAPTMAPTPVPTAAPIMPDDSGSPFTLIYISLGSFVGAVCIARVCFIIYGREGARKRKGGDDLGGAVYRGGGGENGTPQTVNDNTNGAATGHAQEAVKGGGGGGAETPQTVNDDMNSAAIGHAHVYDSQSNSHGTTAPKWILPDAGNMVSVGTNTGSRTMSAAAAAAVYSSSSKELGVEMMPGNAGLLRGDQTSTTSNEIGENGRGMANGNGTHHRVMSEITMPESLSRPDRPPANNGSRSRAASGEALWSEREPTDLGSQSVQSGAKLTPAVSPLSILAPGAPSAGRQIERAGSMWDGATTSPLQVPGSGGGNTARALMTPASTGKVERSKDDTTFEDALLRAVEKKWTSSRNAGAENMGSTISASRFMSGQGQSQRLTIPRQGSLTDWRSSNGKRSAMLDAGKSWTCQCSFENSNGQNSCLACGRVAPVGRPRARPLAVRQSSWIPPGEV